MGIFSEQKTQNQTPENPRKINPAVLEGLNLTQADVDSHFKSQQLETFSGEVTEEAKNYYKDAASGTISFKQPRPVKLGEIAFQPKPVSDITEIPDALYAEFKIIEAAMNPDDKKTVEQLLNTFCETLGKTALDAKDWKTAVNAIDLVTEGGIIHNPEVIKKIGETFASDKELRKGQIAPYIQQRIDAKSSTVPVATPLTATASESQAQTDSKTSTEPAAASQLTAEQISPKLNVDEIIDQARKKLDQAQPKNFNQLANQRGGLVEPVGTPTAPILGESRLNPAPTTPANPQVLTEAPPNPNLAGTPNLTEAPPNPNPNGNVIPFPQKAPVETNTSTLARVA